MIDATLRHLADERVALLRDMLEVSRRGVAGAARPACCAAPFQNDHNWMVEYPTAFVIPVGAGQRSDAEANRLVRLAAREPGRGARADGARVVRGPDVRRRLLPGAA